MDSGARKATIYGVAKNQTPLRDYTFTFIHNQARNVRDRSYGDISFITSCQNPDLWALSILLLQVKTARLNSTIVRNLPAESSRVLAETMLLGG